MQDIVDLLKDKVLNSEGQRGQPPVAVRMLKPYVDRFDTLVASSLEILGVQFTRGHNKLTSVSTSLGRNAVDVIAVDMASDYGIDTELWPYNHDATHPEARFKNELRVGDLILDILVRHSFVELYREETNQYSTAPYEVLPGPRWGEAIGEETEQVLLGTTFEEPRPIYGKYQRSAHKRFTVIKGWEEFGIDFRDLLDAPFIKGLNKMQQTPWMINQAVLKAVKAKRGELRLHEGVMPEDRSSMEAKVVLKARSKNYAFDKVLAKADYIGAAVFWQLYDCDYRGRAYCRESFLEFQGSDEARGLFMFADGKPLGYSGLRWLKIHAASCYNASYEIDEIPEWCEGDYKSLLEEEGLRTISVDKMTLGDRVRWVDNHEGLIRETALHDVFHGEKKVSFLACCFELVNAFDKGVDYVCHLPIPIDGSNNGWQHLAAMSKDEQAGALVSLTDQEYQADFYVKVAKRLFDISEGETKELLRTMPMKDIRKGIAKRAAMTRAYSCGARRMAESMWADCYAEGFHTKYGVTEELCTKLSKDIIKAIADVCPGPLSTMKYLQELANYEITQNKHKDSGHAPELFWESPSGFPVRYKAYKTKAVKHKGWIAAKPIKHSGRVEFDVPDLQKFASGISPNFVHSQDAAHMAITAAEWHGVFGPVHDSFSTHACDVDELGELVRNVFIRMYDHEDYFEEIRYAILSEDGTFSADYTLGNLNIQDVSDSRYFFC